MQREAIKRAINSRDCDRLVSIVRKHAQLEREIVHNHATGYEGKDKYVLTGVSLYVYKELIGRLEEERDIIIKKYEERK